MATGRQNKPTSPIGAEQATGLAGSPDKIAQMKEEKWEKQRLDDKATILKQEITKLQENCNELTDNKDMLENEIKILQVRIIQLGNSFSW